MWTTAEATRRILSGDSRLKPPAPRSQLRRCRAGLNGCCCWWLSWVLCLLIFYWVVNHGTLLHKNGGEHIFSKGRFGQRVKSPNRIVSLCWPRMMLKQILEQIVSKISNHMYRYLQISDEEPIRAHFALSRNHLGMCQHQRGRSQKDHLLLHVPLDRCHAALVAVIQVLEIHGCLHTHVSHWERFNFLSMVQNKL